MPIRAWVCQTCHKDVPLDHFEKTNCGKTVDPAYARAVLVDNIQESESVKGTVRVSDASGCPRKRAIMEQEDVAVDPLTFNAAMTGKAWHALMEKHGEGIAGHEIERRLTGTLAGVTVTGKPDRIVKADGCIEDHKNQNDFATKNPRPKEEWAVQLSLYAELIYQADGYLPTKGKIRAHFSTSFPPADEFELWPVKQALDHKPWSNDQYSAGGLLRATELILSKPGMWKTAPMYGKSMLFGKSKTMCDYCPVKGPCWTSEAGAPF